MIVFTPNTLIKSAEVNLNFETLYPVGSIYIKVDNGYELDELHNVKITSPTNGQALVYSTSAGNLWINGIPNIANIAYSVSGSKDRKSTRLNSSH